MGLTITQNYSGGLYLQPRRWHSSLNRPVLLREADDAYARTRTGRVGLPYLSALEIRRIGQDDVEICFRHL